MAKSRKPAISQPSLLNEPQPAGGPPAGGPPAGAEPAKAAPIADPLAEPPPEPDPSPEPLDVEAETAVAAAFEPLTEAGIYDDLPEAQYHSDPCIGPSLSRSLILRLIENSPRHAWSIHPKLGMPSDLGDDSDDEVMDFGTAAHAEFLQGRSIIKRVDFKDWRTIKAKEARKEAYAEGMIPLLTGAYDRAMCMIDALEGFRNRTGAFTKGKPEQTVIWQDGAIWCRARVDWLPDDYEANPWDLKSTAGFATLAAWGRVCFSKGAHLQDSFYCRGLEMVRGEPPGPMKFCVVEQKPPYGIGVFEMTPITRDLADGDVRSAIQMWEDSIVSGLWPTYSEETQYVDPPGWVVRDRENRSMLTPRNMDLLRGRDHPNAVGYIESGNFGG
jgi:hypothetical protein